MLFLQTLYALNAFGSLSGNKYPWKPSAGGSNQWKLADRFFLMQIGIVEMGTVFFNILPFYLTIKILKESHSSKIFDPLNPISWFRRFFKSLVLFVLFCIYLAGCGYVGYLFLDSQISTQDFFLYISIATTAGAVIGPLFLILYAVAYNSQEFINSNFRKTVMMLLFWDFVWMSCRLYRGVHGIIDNNLIIDMIADQDTYSMVWRGLVYFFSSLFPYLFLISGFLFPSFFISQNKEEEYMQHMIHNTNEDTNEGSSLN